MVQLFYYETRGQPVRKLLRREGSTKKILLFPYEGWAQPASAIYWILKTNWWSKTHCKITQVSGTKKLTTSAKMSTSSKPNTMVIVGRFKDLPSETSWFRLSLTTDVSNADFQMGYSMVGFLERGPRWDNPSSQMQMTHFAMIKRKGY